MAVDRSIIAQESSFSPMGLGDTGQSRFTPFVLTTPFATPLITLSQMSGSSGHKKLEIWHGIAVE